MAETKRVVINCFVFVGAEELQAWEVPADYTEQDLTDLAWECACDYAESYGVANPGEGEDWEDQDAYDEAYSAWEQVEGWWRPYDADTHDGRLIYGSNTEVEWNRA
jgi:hypothetical protein